MNARQAKKLKVGDKVMWQGSHTDLGEVIEVGYCAVKIKWDNGQVGLVQHDDMTMIDLDKTLIV